MFKKGDYIIYSCRGVCLIKDIKEKTIENKKNMYYIMHPVNIKNSIIMTPVDNEKVKMRKVMKKEKAEDIIDTLLDNSDLPRITDKKMRERVYNKMLKEGNPSELVEIINALNEEENEKRAEGRKKSATDEKYLEKAKELLFTELSVSLGVGFEQIKQRVESILQEKLKYC
ncbi:CarD family transcriptional regulator [Mobilitalea sibirica]|uniref:CarD family transcriptional regulator n=1 Tax=Mobilitalea sibirica TaxID=1462919 RepID=A0A8J7H4B6_9FIRM|nr:CarD family transcriptional regulator [Mobilitalea sibirica]MBH1939301.1 CarD family transcriptional regulator [Mobilitalea sibirica]